MLLAMPSLPMALPPAASGASTMAFVKDMSNVM